MKISKPESSIEMNESDHRCENTRMNPSKTIAFFSCGLVMLLASVGYAQDLELGLITHFKFDETSGNYAYDSSDSDFDSQVLGGTQWSDGLIDGTNSEDETVEDYDGNDATIIVEKDPAFLTVPGTNKTVQQTEELLDEESQQTGTTTDTSALADGTIQATALPAEVDTDKDDDGVLNSNDA